MHISPDLRKVWLIDAPAVFLLELANSRFPLLLHLGEAGNI